MKMDKSRVCLWVDTTKYLLVKNQGIQLTSLFDRFLSLWLDLPEDPREKLIKEKMDNVVLRLRSTYALEMQEIIKNHYQQTTQQNEILNKENELREFGKYLRKCKIYPAFEMSLMNKDIDEDQLESITREINSMNGRTYQPDELWNRAIDWYSKYGRAAV